MIQFFRPSLLAAVLLALSPAAHAVIPPAEKILPADTLVVISIPDYAKASDVFKKSAFGRLLDDPAMKPFRDKFNTKFKGDFLNSLERELGVKLDSYTRLAQGQFTVAVTQEGWSAQGGEPAVLLLLDAREKSGQLKTNLTDLRKKWVEAGKTVKMEKIRNLDFMVLPLSSNDVPATIRNYFPQSQPIQELGRDNGTNGSSRTDLYLGQYETLLIAGDSAKAVEKVVARLTGGSVPALADEAAFETDRLALFRDAPYFGWFNAKRFFGVLMSRPPDQPNPDAPSLLPQFDTSKILAATGLAGLRTVAFSSHYTDAGCLSEMFIGAPEATRQGLFKILATPPKDAGPPGFIPADTVQFQRTRIDGQQAIATIEKMLQDISPQAYNIWTYFITLGSAAQKEKDPDFDLKKNLFGSLGDDFIGWTKNPRGSSAEAVTSPPTIFLIGTPTPEKMANAIKVLLSLTSSALEVKEREFIGRKIYSLSVPARRGSAAQTFSYTASGGYVAISMDVALLEEYLRSNDGQLKPLRDLPGLAEAAQKVGGQNTGFFTYQNEVERMRVIFDNLRRFANTDTNSPHAFNPLANSMPFVSPEKSVREWLDFSLLPEYARVSKYFSFSVFSLATTTDGLYFKTFSPASPGLK